MILKSTIWFSSATMNDYTKCIKLLVRLCTRNTLQKMSSQFLNEKTKWYILFRIRQHQRWEGNPPPVASFPLTGLRVQPYITNPQHAASKNKMLVRMNSNDSNIEMKADEGIPARQPKREIAVMVGWGLYSSAMAMTLSIISSTYRRVTTPWFLMKLQEQYTEITMISIIRR